MAASLSRSSSPGVTRRRQESDVVRALLAELVLKGRPALAHLIEEALGIGGEAVAIGFPAEQIEPLRRDREEAGVTGGDDAPGGIDRVGGPRPPAADPGGGGGRGPGGPLAERARGGPPGGPP